ncbi:hypothetical protein CBM2604_A140105 [Cupriavidus taiwanensis]|nr:hypothetical protein CBM2604_A140105 [Cupriavidus taiwanensis]SOZ45048.1 hypothetical protein CBM2610_A160101 [Cupriavidus taiwanensis]
MELTYNQAWVHSDAPREANNLFLAKHRIDPCYKAIHLLFRNKRFGRVLVRSRLNVRFA